MGIEQADVRIRSNSRGGSMDPGLESVYSHEAGDSPVPVQR
jgi:hypothetical protein